MNAEDWIKPGESLPPESVIVDTISAGGLQQRLKRRGRLWFVPDGSMYVYYEVALWRSIGPRQGTPSKPE